MGMACRLLSLPDDYLSSASQNHCPNGLQKGWFFTWLFGIRILGCLTQAQWPPQPIPGEDVGEEE